MKEVCICQAEDEIHVQVIRSAQKNHRAGGSGRG